MRSLETYIIVKISDIDRLEKLVQYNMSLGYICIGGLCVRNKKFHSGFSTITNLGIFYQAMILKEVDHDACNLCDRTVSCSKRMVDRKEHP